MSLTLTGAGSGSEVVTVLTGYQTAVLADSPVRYWKLNETSGTTATDTQGNGNGTYVGPPTLGQAPAIGAGTSVAFAAGQYVTATGPLLALPLTTWTIEAWVKKASITSGATIFMERTAANPGLIGVVIDASGRLFINIRNDAGAIDSLASSTVNVADGAFHHVAVKMSGTTITFYADGAPSGTATRTNATGAMTTSELRWAEDTAGNADWVGSLDELALYTTALSDARILAHFNARNS